MSKYQILKNNPPTLTVKEGAREVIFNLISVMCDNKQTLRFKKNSEGDFKMDGGRNALSNFQMKFKYYEIEWKADEENWGSVIRMVNSGVSVIESVSSR